MASGPRPEGRRPRGSASVAAGSGLLGRRFTVDGRTGRGRRPIRRAQRSLCVLRRVTRPSPAPRSRGARRRPAWSVPTRGVLPRPRPPLWRRMGRQRLLVDRPSRLGGGASTRGAVRPRRTVDERGASSTRDRVGTRGTARQQDRTSGQRMRLPDEGSERRVVAAARGPSHSWPDALVPLARAIAPARRPRLVTGVAARAALDAAAARAATVGDRVLLQRPPGSRPGDLEVVAHELSHVAERASRPRFLLRSASGVLDAGERRARELGSRVAASRERAVRSTTDLATGVRDRLGSAPASALAPAGDLVERARTAAERGAAAPTSVLGAVDGAARHAAATAERAAGQAGRPALEAVTAGRGLADQARDRAHAIGTEGRRRPDHLSSRVTDTIAQHHRRGASAAGALGEAGRGMVDDARRSAAQASTTARGRADAALRAAHGLTGRTLAAGQEHVDRFGAELGRPADLLAGGADRLRTPAASLPVGPRAVVSRVGADLQDRTRSASASAARHAAGTRVAGDVAAAGTAATRVTGDVAAAGTAAGTAASRLAKGAAPTIDTRAASTGRAAATADAAVDDLLEHLEERLLEELERRGGRYGGLF
jgi:hypothetical protein